jgi:membrane protein involved in D-alanine export
MFEFSNILPFSSVQFYYFFAASVLVALVAKWLFSSKIKYKYIVLLINTLYLILFFPKPLQLLLLILFSYFSIRILAKKGANYFTAVLVLSFPLIMMKLIGIHTFGKANEKLANIFQIVGISYITFRSIQVFIDEVSTTKKLNFLDFFNFTVFIPSLLIGPIDRFKRFSNDVDAGYENINSNSYAEGYQLLLKGLVYKYILAEFINRLVLNHLTDDGTLTYHLIYMYSYLIFLFFDFAGYSLLAMSFAKFIGVSLPFNFNQPFLALNPKEFWQRWHKSLGDWLNDYFFKPIFKDLTTKQKFKPITRQNLALLSTFTLMGFWNGLEPHYIVSGILFGIYSMVHNYYVYLCKKNKKDVFFGTLNPKLVTLISIVFMFNAVAFSIYIFSGKLF